MRYKTKYKSRAKWITHHKTLYNAIKKDSLLYPYLGKWIASSRVKGWGKTVGYIQIRTKWIEDRLIQATQYKHVWENVYTSYIELYCESDYSKIGWTEDHTKRIKAIAEQYKVDFTIKTT